MTVYLWKRKVGTKRKTHTEEGDVKAWGEYQLQAEECLSPQKLGEKPGTISPLQLSKGANPANALMSDFHLSALTQY